MNLRDLAYALAVERLKSFSRAAEACDVSQPTLSGQLRKLERALGVDLFERDGRAIRPTPVGQAILEQARIAVDAAERIARLAAAGADPLVGPLRIRMIPTLAPYVLSWLLPTVRTQLSHAPLVLAEDVAPSTAGDASRRDPRGGDPNHGSLSRRLRRHRDIRRDILAGHGPFEPTGGAIISLTPRGRRDVAPLAGRCSLLARPGTEVVRGARSFARACKRCPSDQP